MLVAEGSPLWWVLVGVFALFAVGVAFVAWHGLKEKDVYCPACGRFVGRNFPARCPRCGAKLK